MIKKVHIAILAVLILSSCYTRKVATRQVSRAAIAYRDILAEYCANEYSVEANTDSAGFKESLDSIARMVDRLRADSLLSEQERKRLIAEIERIGFGDFDFLSDDTMVNVGTLTIERCDSLVDALYRLASNQMKRGDRLQEANSRLILAAQNIKPVHDTVINKAPLDACELAMRAAVKNEAEERELRKGWEKKAKSRFWIIVGMGAVISLGLFGFLWRKFNKVTPKL